MLIKILRKIARKLFPLLGFYKISYKFDKSYTQRELLEHYKAFRDSPILAIVLDNLSDNIVTRWRLSVDSDVREYLHTKHKVIEEIKLEVEYIIAQMSVDLDLPSEQ